MRNFVIISLVATFCFGAHPARVSDVGVLPMNENLGCSFFSKLNTQDFLIRHVIDSGIVCLSYSSKNVVFAEDGQNVAVIYGRFNGNPVNMYNVVVTYSTDRGNTWIGYGPINTLEARRVNPALDANENWPDPSDLRVHFTWHEAVQISGTYDSSPAYYAKEVSYPNGLITGAFRLPNSGARDVWAPCIGVKDSFVIITASNNGTFLTTYDSYIWRSTDYGGTWDTELVQKPSF
jgi:hypothetical protein